MAKRRRTTFQKYAKERARQKQQAKAARRLDAKQRWATTEAGSDDLTPDSDRA